MIRPRGAECLHALFLLLDRGEPIQNREVQILHGLRIVLLFGHDLGDAVGRILDGVGDDRAVHHGQDRAEVHAAGAFAFAGALADRLAEEFEESAGQFDVAIGKQRRPRTRRQARQLAQRTGHLVDRIVEHLGRQSPSHGVRIIDVVVLVPFVRLDRKLIRAALADGLDCGPHVEVALHEFRGEAVEQFGVGGGIAGADVVDRFDDAVAQHVRPHSVRIAAGEVRILRRRDPLRGRGAA